MLAQKQGRLRDFSSIDLANMRTRGEGGVGPKAREVA